MQRVVNVVIPTAVYSPSSSVDITLVDRSPNGLLGCGDSTTEMSLILTNLGITDSNSLAFFLKMESSSNESTLFDTMFVNNGMGSCTLDTLNFGIHTYDEGFYEVHTFHTNSNDSNSLNDSLFVSIESFGHPILLPKHDTLCSPTSSL
ncbi:MAG: hypothetical protein ACI9QR_001889 [Flavobacteriaceae bacterium]|jgi:hypothetical protein